MILNFKNKIPTIHESCFVAPNATIIGGVKMAENASDGMGGYYGYRRFESVYS